MPGTEDERSAVVVTGVETTDKRRANRMLARRLGRGGTGVRGAREESVACPFFIFEFWRCQMPWVI